MLIHLYIAYVLDINRNSIVSVGWIAVTETVTHNVKIIYYVVLYRKKKFKSWFKAVVLKVGNPGQYHH